ncbi:LysM peptidoglycan-binding domain-containing protein [Nitratireductor basaltis]|uniref:Peptidoglycan-binding LysM n=1 Tax=Nitratireductor basaltis TaxID=472175 RepID=A0A084UC76_9HYPH|nr:LysM peptidoglycan-binding domain-containing protein [Nitratireductor basaltis]KFB10562.1 Peptidoglycan-binding LysM precursor [Nitratireductor basaltis]
MPTAPIKILLYVLGALVGAAGVAYYTGTLDPLLDKDDARSQVAATQDQGESGTSGAPASTTTAKSDRSEASSDNAGADDPAGAAAEGEGTQDGEVAVPRFDLVRAEPNGSLVVAGNAAPESEIEVLSGTRVLAKVRSGPSGDFVAVLEDPLSAGDHNIVLRSTSPDKLAATSVETAIVSIPEDDRGQVLAMVQEPGAPTRVVSRPEAPKPVAHQPGDGGSTGASSDAATTETADSSQATSAEGEQQAVLDRSAQNAGGEEEVAASQGTSSAETGETDARAQVAQSSDAGSTADETAQPQVNTETAQAQVGADAVDEQTASGLKDSDAATDETREMAAATSAGDDTAARAAVGPAQATGLPDDTTLSVMPFIEAVEIDGEQVFVAGRAAKGATVRVYFDDMLIGQSEAGPDGHFLVDARREIPVGNYTVRVDVIGADGAEVIARAAVPFTRESGSHVAAVASAPQSTSQSDTASADNESGDRAQAGATGDSGSAGGQDPFGAASSTAESDPVMPVEEQETANSSDGSGEAADTSADAAASGATGIEATDREMAAVAADGSNTSEDTANAGSPSASMSETTAPALQPVDGAVIIRRGDTLWHISRRVYGRGLRYTTIYLANQDQIRDPDLIWPGQVFALPAESAEGEPADLSVIQERRRGNSPN